MDHSHHHGHNHGGHDGHVMSTPTIPPPAHIMDHDQSGHGDHSMGNQSSSMNHHNMMMHMFFHGGTDETILFEFWKISEPGGLLLSMVLIFFLAFGYEGLKFYREHLYRHSFQTVQLSTVAVPVENGTLRETHKTVQIGTTAISNSPYNPEMNPVFLTKTTCECAAGTSRSLCPKNGQCPDCQATETCDACDMCENSNNNNDNNSNNNGAPVTCGTNACSSKFKAKLCTPVRASYKVKILSAMHCWQTVLHIVQMVISYFLMLIFMTYNVWLCIAVALGAGVGYFCFGWKKSVVVDVTEHCH